MFLETVAIILDKIETFLVPRRRIMIGWLVDEEF